MTPIRAIKLGNIEQYSKSYIVEKAKKSLFSAM